MNLKEIESNLLKISDIYAEKFSIDRTEDWFLLKIQEELGELSAAYLKLTGRARTGNSTQADLEKNLHDELADVLAMTLLFAQSRNIDVEKALKDKWFKYLD